MRTFAGALAASTTEDSFTEGSSAAPSADLSGLWTDTSSGSLPGPVVGRLVTAAADKLALGDTSPTGAARPVSTRPAPACPCAWSDICQAHRTMQQSAWQKSLLRAARSLGAGMKMVQTVGPDDSQTSTQPGWLEGCLVLVRGGVSCVEVGRTPRMRCWAGPCAGKEWLGSSAWLPLRCFSSRSGLAACGRSHLGLQGGPERVGRMVVLPGSLEDCSQGLLSA